jgi:hypothetical protein
VNNAMGDLHTCPSATTELLARCSSTATAGAQSVCSILGCCEQLQELLLKAS